MDQQLGAVGAPAAELRFAVDAAGDRRGEQRLRAGREVDEHVVRVGDGPLGRFGCAPCRQHRVAFFANCADL